MNKLVTVYGSLLEGMGNWRWHLDNDQSEKLGEHILEGPYTMVSLGGFPGLVKIDDNTNKIRVETYRVSDKVFKSIEHLEGYPHFYGRDVIETPFGESVIYTLSSFYANGPKVEGDENNVISWKDYVKSKTHATTRS